MNNLEFDYMLPHLEQYQDLFLCELEIDLLDAVEIRLLPRQNYLAHHAAIGLGTSFNAMIGTPNCRVLVAQLTFLGVHQELIEITVCEWVMQYVTRIYY